MGFWSRMISCNCHVTVQLEINDFVRAAKYKCKLNEEKMNIATLHNFDFSVQYTSIQFYICPWYACISVKRKNYICIEHKTFTNSPIYGTFNISLHRQILYVCFSPLSRCTWSKWKWPQRQITILRSCYANASANSSLFTPAGTISGPLCLIDAKVQKPRSNLAECCVLCCSYHYLTQTWAYRARRGSGRNRSGWCNSELSGLLWLQSTYLLFV